MQTFPSTKFNPEKYTDLMMYILFKTIRKPNFGKTMLCSTLYFIDFYNYELYGELLTNETYVKSKKGIEPLHFKEIITDLISKKHLFFRKEAYYNRQVHKYYPLIIPDVRFDSTELEIIDYSLEKFSNENASTITKYAIKDPPINLADFGEKIDYHNVVSRNKKYSIINTFIKF